MIYDFIQLTNETITQTLEDLSTLVEVAETRPVEQSADNLDSVANVLVNVATFVNESNEEINKTVREPFAQLKSDLSCS